MSMFDNLLILCKECNLIVPRTDVVRQQGIRHLTEAGVCGLVDLALPVPGMDMPHGTVMTRFVQQENFTYAPPHRKPPSKEPPPPGKRDKTPIGTGKEAGSATG